MAKVIQRWIMNAARGLLPQRVRAKLYHFSFAVLPDAERAKVKRIYNMTTLRWTLENLARIGRRLEYVMDVGAYEGEWTEEVLGVFPEARVVCVDGQPSKLPVLQQLPAVRNGRAIPEITLVGSSDKSEVEFYEMETGSSVLFEQCNAPRKKVVRPMTTVDSLVRKHGFPRLDLLKIDVQGYELEVLKGASGALDRTELVLLEVSLLPVIVGAPLMPEVIAFMRERGFVPYEICNLMRRPLDNALWQVDMVFVRENSPLISNHTKGD